MQSCGRLHDSEASCIPQKNRTNYAAIFTYHISIYHLLFWYSSPINTWNRKLLLKLFISIKILLHSLHCTAQTVADRIYFIATHPSNEKPKCNTLIPCLRSNKLPLPQQNLKKHHSKLCKTLYSKKLQNNPQK